MEQGPLEWSPRQILVVQALAVSFTPLPNLKDGTQMVGLSLAAAPLTNGGEISHDHYQDVTYGLTPEFGAMIIEATAMAFDRKGLHYALMAHRDQAIMYVDRFRTENPT